ncbi:MAG: DUF4360 domain-containing protein [Devosia sp.]
MLWRHTIRFASLLAIVVAPGLALADNATLTLGTPAYGGAGCPDGSVTTLISPDKQSFTLVFSAYALEVGGTQTPSDRVSCNLVIPVTVPAGLQISIEAIDLLGSTDLPEGADGIVTSEAFFSGGQGPNLARPLKGPTADPVLIRNPPADTAPAWSNCGTDVNLRLNSAIRLTTKPDKPAKASITLANVYRLATKAC